MKNENYTSQENEVAIQWTVTLQTNPVQRPLSQATGCVDKNYSAGGGGGGHYIEPLYAKRDDCCLMRIGFHKGVIN